jgi:glycosyltransferase involved in cell wall biosynthesis
MLEAAAVGARVIATAEAVPSVLSEHVECFPARDARALGALMEQVLERPEPSRRDALRVSARRWTWDRCARATAEVYREVLAESEAR